MSALSDQPKIKPLFDLMNATGCIQAINACQGECFGKWGVRAPFVLFEATFECGEALARHLAELCLDNSMELKGTTHYNWNISPRFNWTNSISGLVYTLHSPDLNGIAKEVFSPYWTMGLWRKKLDHDLSVLTSYLAPLLLQIGQGKEVAKDKSDHQEHRSDELVPPLQVVLSS